MTLRHDVAAVIVLSRYGNLITMLAARTLTQQVVNVGKKAPRLLLNGSPALGMLACSNAQGTATPAGA